MPKMTLRALRINAGLTQKEAAKALNKSTKTLGNWESGATFPKPKDIEAICELYNVAYDHINFLHTDSL